jgi:hypothetical protein
LALLGERGSEAVIPLEGMNKKYGEELLKYIIPKYYPDLIKLQAGGMIGGGGRGGNTYGGDTNYSESYSIQGPITITGVSSPEDFMNQLKLKSRASKRS